jgi:glycosyltransferase involved in cell wall biosynthesis
MTAPGRARRPLVSIALPVYNGEATVADVARSVLAQDYGDVELVISDNASQDGTEEICRGLARDDDRVAYHRQAENVGLLGNFAASVRLARGDFVRWIGHDDWIAPSYVSRCLEVFAADERLILVTTQLDYVEDSGQTASTRYTGAALGSADAVDRFAEMLRLQTLSYTMLDPLYGLMRRPTAVALRRRQMVREDEIFAAELALAGPWGHIPEVLARRAFSVQSAQAIARKIGSPVWHSRINTVLHCRELLRIVAHGAATAALTPEQARRARGEIGRLYVRRTSARAVRAWHKLARPAVVDRCLVSGTASR